MDIKSIEALIQKDKAKRDY